MKVNVRKECELQHDITGGWLELDIWLPRLHLAFEFQVSFFLFFWMMKIVDEMR
jgi:hypothetical protein